MNATMLPWLNLAERHIKKKKMMCGTWGALCNPMLASHALAGRKLVVVVVCVCCGSCDSLSVLACCYNRIVLLLQWVLRILQSKRTQR